MNQFIEMLKKALSLPTISQADRAVKFAELVDLWRTAVSLNFFMKASALYDLIKGVASLGFKADAVRMIEDLGNYLAQKSSGTLSKPQMVELQRTFIWTHAEVVGHAPKSGIEALYGEIEIPQDVKDILAAAVARHGSSPRERVKQLGADVNAALVGAGFTPFAQTAGSPAPRIATRGELIMTDKGLLERGRDMGHKIKQLTPEQQAARCAEKKREAALRRVNAKVNKASRKAAKAAEAAAAAAKSKGRKK